MPYYVIEIPNYPINCKIDLKTGELKPKNSVDLKLELQIFSRGTSILGEVRNDEIPGPTQQLLCSKSYDFLAIFALAHSKIHQIA